MREERRGILYLVSKLQAIEKENAQLKAEIRSRENFNRRLCSENKRRRASNNELRRKQNQRLLQLASLKGYEAEYKKLAENFKKAMEEGEEKYEACEDEKTILNVELAKCREELVECQATNKQLAKQLGVREAQIERLTIMQEEQDQRKKTTSGYQVDYENEVMRLICDNQIIEMRIKEEEMRSEELREGKARAEGRCAALEEELEAFREIVNIMRIEYQQEMKQTLKMTPKEEPARIKQTPAELTTFRPKSKINLDQYGKRLANKNEEYFMANHKHLLFSGSVLQNLSTNPVAVHYCEPINLSGNHSWFTRVRLVAEGELNLGLTTNPFSGEDVMSFRNYIYYNNCSGLIVVDKEGKIIDKYASVNDTLTLTLSALQDSRILRVFKNDLPIYESQLPDRLAKATTLYPYVKLFQFMSVDIQ